MTYSFPNIDISIGNLNPTAPPSAPPTTPTNPISATPGADAYLRNLLREYGLESLTEWALSALRRGLSAEQIVQEMRNTPEFKDRFPAIEARKAAGLPPISPGEYVQYEREARQTMMEFGLPADFYNSTDDFTRLLVADVSPNELRSRVESGYNRMMMAPPEVRDVFNDWFGVNGNSALAAFFLDPDRAKPVIMKMAEQAFVGGTGRRFGFEIDPSVAAQVVSTGGSGQAPDAFSGLAEARAYFDETISETQDLRAEDEGVRAAFSLDGEAAQTVRRRQEQRAAQFGGVANTGAPGSAQDYGRGR